MAKIPVVLCIDARIILGTAVTIKSMLETAKPETTYDIRIFHSGLSASDEKNLQELVAGTRHELKLHYIDPARFDGAPRNKGSWTEIVYYRLLTPEILTEYDKAIYSDVDVLIKEDLSEAYNTDLEGYEIAAVPTTLNEVLKTLQPARYFEENKNKYIYASGFIVFNNKLMREEKTVDKFFDTIKTFNSRLVFFDMDTLNITCNKVKDLPLKYCVFETLYEYTDVMTIPEYKNLKTVYSDAELYEAKNHPIVIHYAGKLGKPWQRKRVPQYYQEYIDKLGQKYQRYTFRDLRKKFLSKPKYPEQHFDVGLVNFYHSQNYGACLTAYALQEAIKSLGYSCAFVNEFYVRKKYNLSFGKLFVNRYLKLMPKFDNPKQAGKLASCYITGSDQVFRPDYQRKKSNGDLFLLNFVPENIPKFAFSASFGVGEDEFLKNKSKYINKIKKALSKFDYISVRELSGVEICKKYLNTYAEHVIDPIFIVNRKIFEELAQEATGEYKNKIISYILDENKSYSILYKKLSKKYNLEICELSGKNISVNEWVKAFTEAEYVITDSYHGVCFALLYNKPFIAVLNKRRGVTRFESLKEIFKIENGFLNLQETAEYDYRFEPQNWQQINAIINEESEKAKCILNNILSSKKKDYITKNCTGCGACYNICPNNAISMEENNEGFLYPRVNSKKCTNCQLCKRVCPTATMKSNNNRKIPQCYAMMADDNLRLSGCSSGGASQVLMNYILSNNGFIAGAVYDENWKVIQTITNDKECLANFKGSKYYQGDTLKTFSDAKDILEQGYKLLYTGTPCQIAGLKSFLNKDYTNLFTIDIVCHGVPSYKVFKMYLDSILSKEEQIQVIDFRNKKNGWNNKLLFCIETDSRIYESNSKANPFMTAFLGNYILRKSCFKCPFQSLPRQGDLTIGDFWRIQKYNENYDDKKGTSLILVNSDKGECLLSDIQKNCKLLEEVPLKYAIKGNRTIMSPTKNNIMRDEFLLSLSGENFSELVKKYAGRKFNG